MSEVRKSTWKGLASNDSIQCLIETFNETLVQEQRCSAFWDGIYCWPSTPLGHNVTRTCGEVMKGRGEEAYVKKLIGDVTRICGENGTWFWTELSNYTSCTSVPPNNENNMEKGWPMKEIIRHTLFIGSIFSLLFLTIAIFLFSYFKSIRCPRITIHIHFMLALAIKSSVLILISDPTSFSDKYYYRDVDWICKLVVLTQLYSYLASINWTLIQGHFLNSKLSTDVFGRSDKLKCYYVFGWGIPLILVLIWYRVMENYHTYPCWKNYSKSKYIWIIVAPMFTALLVNLAFLVNIIRILVQKCNVGAENEMEQFRKASKATAALFPLLGLNNLIFFFNPGGSWIFYYMMANAILQPFQGIAVSILYCFVCHDIRECIRREYWKFSVRRSVNVDSLPWFCRCKSLQRKNGILSKNLVSVSQNDLKSTFV